METETGRENKQRDRDRERHADRKMERRSDVVRRGGNGDVINGTVMSTGV